MSARARSRLLLPLLVAACHGGRTEPSASVIATGGDAERGAHVIREKGCGTCHTIPGIRAANGLVGPPLYWFAERTIIAGRLPNTPDNLVQWVQNPQSVDSLTAMPMLGLTEQQARDVAAYLYTLR